MKKGKTRIVRPIKHKTMLKIGIGSGIVFGIVACTYIFANQYTIKLRSPFQNPIIINERMIQAEPLKPVLELESEPEQVKIEQESDKLSFTPSNRLVAQTKQRSDIYARIVAIFGHESMKYGELISRESGLNPHAINPTSGACGLAQALPCSKMACELSDVDCQLVWIKKYVGQRYGDIDRALAFHNDNNWY